MLGKENVHVIYGVFVLFHDRGGSQQPGGQYDSSHAYQPGPFSTTPMPGSTVRCQETWSCDTLWVTLGSSGHQNSKQRKELLYWRECLPLTDTSASSLSLCTPQLWARPELRDGGSFKTDLIEVYKQVQTNLSLKIIMSKI